MSALDYIDEEFGSVAVKRIARTHTVRVKITANGKLTATLPPRASLSTLKRLIDSSRDELRKALQQIPQDAQRVYRHDDRVGSSHRVILYRGQMSDAAVKGLNILWSVPATHDPDDEMHQEHIRDAVRKALNKEAKAYLPRQLQYLADNYGFTFSRVRYGNPKGRWGSCTSQKVISLNVALMNLPKELIDYVLVHELSHTVHLNHSSAFWEEVARCFPSYRIARKQLKTFSPYL